MLNLGFKDEGDRLAKIQHEVALSICFFAVLSTQVLQIRPEPPKTVGIYFPPASHCRNACL